MTQTAVMEKAFATDKPCALVGYHAPLPVMTEHHHSKPSYLQTRLYGKVVYAADIYYCSNCHDAVHAWTYWLMGERQMPMNMGRNAKAAGQAIYDWFNAEKTRLGL